MTFAQAIRSGFANCVNFRGRATPSEFWWWQLFVFLAAIAVAVLDLVIDPNNQFLARLWSLIVFIPSVAVAVRRYHHADMSGWWLLLILVPVIGFVMLIIWWIGEGTAGYNRFGADPRPQEVSLHERGRSLLRARTDTAN
jgi:uncharacterized membrane protein YhaH (DUF805 family)